MITPDVCWDIHLAIPGSRATWAVADGRGRYPVDVFEDAQRRYRGFEVRAITRKDPQ